MRHASICVLIVAVVLPVTARAQPSMPPRWDDLPKQAASWPPAWAALVRDAMAVPDFDERILRGVSALLSGEQATPETYRLAEVVLSATLRHHRSVQGAAPLAGDPPAVHGQLVERLANVRKDWLDHLRNQGADAEALRLADRWLPFAGRDDPVASATLMLWTRQAEAALAKSDHATARRWLDRLEARFDRAGPVEAIAKSVRMRAESLAKEAMTLPDAQATRMLEEALTLWPRLPEARDALERRKGTSRTLVVAVRSLPERLSPMTASTEVEQQALELLFDRLYQGEQQRVLGKRYRPQLAADLPADARAAAIDLRSDVYWSSGEGVTAADLRHTAFLMNQADLPGRSALWRDFLEMPRVEGNPFHVTLGYRQGLFDPAAALTFWVMPQYYRGKQLQRGDDPDFAQAPIGSGPYQYLGRKTDAGKVYAVFQANPHDLREPISSVREIRMAAWTDPRKDVPKPLPHLVLDAPSDHRKPLRDLGYTAIDLKNTNTVCILAVNHRRPSLASVAVRRTIAHALDRRALLNRHFRSEADKDHTTANGLFPRGSWAVAPAPRVPIELFQPEQARSFARQAKKEDKRSWTLKYPAGDPRVKAACEEIAAGIETIFQEAKLACDVKTAALAPSALRKAIHERDYDLAYTTAENLDDPVRLALVFDRQEDATSAGGSNFLGYDSDEKLAALLRGALQRRQFSAVQESMQAVDVHLYETMPAIPLWQLDTQVMVHATLKTSGLDPRAVFATVREWKIDR